MGEITPQENAAMLAEAQRRQAEFAEWSAGVQAGKIRLEGVERDAQRVGYWAGRRRLDSDAQKAETRDYTARQRVAYVAGYAEGRARPRVPADAPPPPSAAELIAKARQRPR